MNKLRHRMPLAFLAMLIVLLVNAYITRVNTQALLRNSQEAAQSRRILLALARTLSTVKDAETGQRGYLLVQNDKYLAPYTQAVAQIHEELAQLKSLTAANALRGTDVAAVSDLINRKLDELAKTLRLNREQGPAAAIALVKTDLGQSLMAAIRTKMEAMVTTESDYLAALSDEAQASSRTRTYTFALATLAAIACVCAAFMFVRRDLIEREQAAEEAERQRQLLAVTLTSVGDAVIATDNAGRVTFLNEVGEQVTGWSTEEAAGRNIDEVFHIINEASRKTVESPVEKVLREGKIVGLANHTILIRRDGTEIPIDDSGAPIRDRAGQILGVIIVFRDVTELKQAERTLRATEARFRVMADSAPVLVWMADTTKGCTWFNRPWLEFTGRRLEEELGDGWAAGVHSEDLARCLEIYQRAFDAREPFEMEYRLRRHDGVYRWTFDRGVPLYDTGGAFSGYIGMVLDITDRKELEKAREELLIRERAARAQAETASQAKDDFLAVLSHELRTPLTPVLATVRALQKNPVVEAAAHDDLEMIRRNAELEARLIDDLLDLTRVSKNKLQLNLETVDVHLALRQVLEICGVEVESKRQEVTVTLEATRPHVRADAARLQQMLWNLLKNACKFTPAEGAISIATRNLPEGGLRIEVRDSGIGIEPEEMGRLFNAFEQGNKQISRTFGGLGLGLAITRALAAAHGGTVSAASEGRGKGAMFSLELGTVDALPVSPAAQAQDGRSRDGLRGPGPCLRLLLVEDHEDTLRTMARLVRLMGHRVETASSVQEGAALAQDQDFDLILSDIGLPDGSGIDLIRRVRTNKPTPAIALTGFGMEQDVRRSLDAGFAAHLTKPVNFEQLEMLIREIGGGTA